MNRKRAIGTVLAFASWATGVPAFAEPAADGAANHWTWCGWGGGGYMWTASYHPTKPGVIYMGGDCAGCYKTEDDGQHWRMINDGIVDYTVYGMAVDAKSPDTVYAVTEQGLCKSVDAGEHWTFLPDTGKKKLAIFAERHVSVRPLAVDPSDSRIVYAATPLGKIYKSEDGAQTWKQVFQLPALETAPQDALRAEFAAGGVFGAFFIFVTPPAAMSAETCKGFGLTLRSNGHPPKNAVVSLWGPDGAVYQSKNLAPLLEKTDWQDIVLSADDFTISAEHARQDKARAPTWPKQPDWKTVHRMDFTCSGIGKATVVLFRSVYFALADSQKAVVRDFAADKRVNAYGSINVKGPKPGAFASISISQKNPQLVLAASPQGGVFLSPDAGMTWNALNTPKTAKCVVADPKDANILYGAFAAEGMYKSVDGGKTWSAINDGIKPNCTILEIAISPANAKNMVCIGSMLPAWNGYAFWSADGGQQWHQAAPLKNDLVNNPASGVGGLSRPTNIAYCPTDPKKLYVSGNWRPAFSDDGGRTWTERDRGADISCVFDVRFHGKRAYAACMDEGVFCSEDDGAFWQNPWHGDARSAGHYWRLAIADGSNGADRIVATCSPWAPALPNCVVVSEDGGKKFKIVNQGLPPKKPTVNAMWGTGYARALAVDPQDPKTLYLGIDGDSAGIFKSTDGGYSWKQLAHQPASRRMFFGLVVDPTNSRRLYWAGANGKDAGVYRSNDGGDSWKFIKPLPSCFNLAVSGTGVIYGGDKDLWRSNDHGDTWKKLTNMAEGCIEGLEIDPTNEKRIWFSTVRWGGAAWGFVMKTADGGATWQDITGDLGYRKPAVLRFNPATQELWAGGVGLFRIKQ